MNWSQRTFGVIIALLYLVLAGGLVYLAYRISPPKDADQWKEFGVRAGIAFAVVGAFIGIIVSFFTLSVQIRAARELEDKREGILKSIEDRRGQILISVEEKKKELSEEIEKLRGNIARQNELLIRAYNARSAVYDEIITASNNCYRELQNLARGQYDNDRVAECERSLRKAEGLAAILEDEDQKIITQIVQIVFNIVGEVETLRLSGKELKQEREKIWNKNVRDFGQAMEELRNRSLFHNRSITSS